MFFLPTQCSYVLSLHFPMDGVVTEPKLKLEEGTPDRKWTYQWHTDSAREMGLVLAVACQLAWRTTINFICISKVEHVGPEWDNSEKLIGDWFRGDSCHSIGDMIVTCSFRFLSVNNHFFLSYRLLFYLLSIQTHVMNPACVSLATCLLSNYNSLSFISVS